MNEIKGSNEEPRVFLDLETVLFTRRYARVNKLMLTACGNKCEIFVRGSTRYTIQKGIFKELLQQFY